MCKSNNETRRKKTTEKEQIEYEKGARQKPTANRTQGKPIQVKYRKRIYIF